MITRPPAVADGPTIRNIAMKFAAIMYPELIGEIDKVHWLVRDCTNNAQQHWSRVIGPEGAPRAALLTRTENNLWAAKKSSAVLLWWSDIPGGGIALLREYRKWVKENQQQIVIAGFTADWCMINETPLRIAERVGFKQRGAGGYFYHPRFDKCRSLVKP